ncbi:MerR family transcriptional regulator [Photobacterium sp. TY1-4]|uniref:MerR family transcriptional regulator n=1 Tax=Photobacterium sp. TY1-4 TaxID=2899122 RepID=UPI0021BF3072|nr:MerR family transcriptional regulator [Photobacterium sp. TY1-4]UXI03005.1 MerR family transcriptional regulator [Photobacterium sp. TY1-4]
MYIGALAKQSGVSIKAIRYYEDIGLIKAPQREGKYRVYDESYLPVLAMIKLAKTLGFTLEELKMIARAKTQQGLIPMDLLTTEINRKRARLLEQMQQLNAMLEGLTELEDSVQEYNGCLLQSLPKAVDSPV